MHYYIREHHEAKVIGPFSIDDLKGFLRTGEINSEYFATGDYGENLEQLQVWRSSDWFKLAKIGDLQEVIPAPENISYKPKTKGGYLASNLEFLVTFSLFMLATTKGGWLIWAIFTMSLASNFATLYSLLQKPDM